MSKGFDGVRPASESSIEIGFFYQDRHCVERIRVKPTAANLKRAADRRAAILAAIARGDFDYDAEFPKRKRVTPVAQPAPAAQPASSAHPPKPAKDDA
ncbi:Arm DNA-binding domain-containing protein [Achromobacter sp. UMC71]|uniref:Arm DNA-binding domain-containing protein n=1 Tax=Achromobacter sp. UMC71 TaxID=1862320 RepID=UPI00210687EA|nr:DUF3596 domain-containing protein [Achromobacter sp. UMC71]MBB1624270.1 hypothetical protein [Achromobacter sp. UMC71]